MSDLCKLAAEFPIGAKATWNGAPVTIISAAERYADPHNSSRADMRDRVGSAYIGFNGDTYIAVRESLTGHATSGLGARSLKVIPDAPLRIYTQEDLDEARMRGRREVVADVRKDIRDAAPKDYARDPAELGRIAHEGTLATRLKAIQALVARAEYLESL